MLFKFLLLKSKYKCVRVSGGLFTAPPIGGAVNTI